MKFEELVHRFNHVPLFDLQSLVTLFAEDRRHIVTQLHRWKAQKKLIELKRGLWSLSEAYRKAPLHAPALASALYMPSYLSGTWALSWYGLIPEKVSLLTSVTTRPTRRFNNDLGEFIFQTLKQNRFFGYSVHTVLELPVRIADPEKALLDYWYLESGAWTAARFDSIRLDPGMKLDEARLDSYCARCESRRLAGVVEEWRRFAAVSRGRTRIL
jgi:hypothetical protein